MALRERHLRRATPLLAGGYARVNAAAVLRDAAMHPQCWAR